MAAISISMGPLVSVITPAYNARRTLERAHQSVCVQVYSNWEHVIVDDGSDDGTSGLLSRLARDSRVVTRTVPNGGTGSALNTGIAAARGEYIAFLDADDEYLPHHMSAHVEMLEKHTDIDVLWGGCEVVADTPEAALVPDIEAGRGLIPVSECVVQGTIFARRKVFDQFLFTEDRAIWWQDYEFIQRVRRVFPAARFEQKTYRYYRDSGVSLVDRAKSTWV